MTDIEQKAVEVQKILDKSPEWDFISNKYEFSNLAVFEDSQSINEVKKINELNSLFDNHIPVRDLKTHTSEEIANYIIHYGSVLIALDKFLLKYLDRQIRNYTFSTLANEAGPGGNFTLSAAEVDCPSSINLVLYNIDFDEDAYADRECDRIEINIALRLDETAWQAETLRDIKLFNVDVSIYATINANSSCKPRRKDMTFPEQSFYFNNLLRNINSMLEEVDDWIEEERKRN